jgi:hypothetical protein
MEPIRFKYKTLNDKGQVTGFLSKKGQITGQEVVLDKTPVPLAAIAKTSRRMNRLILVVATQNKPATIVLAVTKGRAEDLKQAVDRLCSSRWAELRQAELAKAGKAAAFRTEPCPYCQSVIDRTGFDETPQVYCSFCETVVTRGPGAPKDEKTYRFCDQCGYYGQPKAFTTFYFIFLLVVVHYQFQTTTRCNACMRSEAWKMFFGNLIFILGFPFAVVQLLRAYLGGSTFSPTFSGLDAANAAARHGRVDKADPLYEAILARAGHAAGVRYNRALAHRAKDAARCAVEAHGALKDCSNYTPAAELTLQALQAMGRQEEADAFSKSWGGGLR